jgi:DNA-binding beta-propeller fold protein YncE
VINAILAASLVTVAAGCSVILGPSDESEEALSAAQIRFQYIETLRDQESLRGESLREVKVYADASTAAQALLRPVSVAADHARVYVTDGPSPGRLAIFDRGLRTMVTLTAPALPAGMVTTPYIEPVAVTVDEAGYVYVADPGQAKVFGLDPAGGLLFTLGKTGDLSYPAALAADPKRGRLYIADRNANRVRVHAFRGEQLFALGGSGKPGDLRRPVGVALDRAGLCYVLDGSRERVFIYDTNGVHLRDFPVSPGEKTVARRPAGIAIDRAGHIYVSDQLNSVILIFDPNGVPLQQWGRMGSGRDEFWSPSGIYIDGQDMIYIADQMNGRVQVYQPVK